MDRTSLAALVQQQLTLARDAASGRSAHTVYSGHARTLRQTLIAMTGGRRLDDHENPGEATLYVLHGRVRLTAGGTAAEAEAGDLLIIPDARHALEAIEDSAVLLTVAKR